MPKVSVLIPMYNAAPYIEAAIESVLEQTFADYELLIVDNRSTDGGLELVRKYVSDPRVRIYQNEENVGMARNWNQCLLYATGEYIKFLCADDLFEPELLEAYVAVMEQNPGVSLLTSRRKFLYPDGRMEETEPFIKGLRTGREVCSEIISGHLNPIGEPTVVMFRRKHLNAGLFNTDMHWTTDIDFWLRLCLLGDVYGLEKSFTIFRQNEGQATNEVVQSGKFLEQERNFIYYNSFIRNSPVKNDVALYRRRISTHLLNAVRLISKDKAKQYLQIWPQKDGILVRLKMMKYYLTRSK